jgi:hypothetical protein
VRNSRLFPGSAVLIQDSYGVSIYLLPSSLFSFRSSLSLPPNFQIPATNLISPLPLAKPPSSHIQHCSPSTPSTCTFLARRAYFQHGVLPANGTVCAADVRPFDPDAHELVAAAVSSALEKARGLRKEEEEEVEGEKIQRAMRAMMGYRYGSVRA